MIYSGDSTLVSIREEKVEALLPRTPILHQNYPNPFNSTTNIVLELPNKGHVSLKVYDITGKEINRLINEVLPEGQHSIIWDGKDSSGREVASGIYIAYFLASGVSASRKLLLLK